MSGKSVFVCLLFLLVGASCEDAEGPFPDLLFEDVAPGPAPGPALRLPSLTNTVTWVSSPAPAPAPGPSSNQTLLCVTPIKTIVCVDCNSTNTVKADQFEKDCTELGQAQRILPRGLMIASNGFASSVVLSFLVVSARACVKVCKQRARWRANQSQTATDNGSVATPSAGDLDEADLAERGESTASLPHRD